MGITWSVRVLSPGDVDPTIALLVIGFHFWVCGVPLQGAPGEATEEAGHQAEQGSSTLQRQGMYAYVLCVSVRKDVHTYVCATAVVIGRKTINTAVAYIARWSRRDADSSWRVPDICRV